VPSDDKESSPRPALEVVQELTARPLCITTLQLQDEFLERVRTDLNRDRTFKAILNKLRALKDEAVRKEEEIIDKK
jgi:hypothetical protein